MITRDKIKKDFLLEAIEYGNAIAIGDNKKANKLHKKLHNFYDIAKEQNVVSLFEELLNEDNENIRFWAATFSLASSPKLAEKTLERLTELSSIIGLSAKTTLQLWKQGRLDLL